MRDRHPWLGLALLACACGRVAPNGRAPTIAELGAADHQAPAPGPAEERPAGAEEAGPGSIARPVVLITDPATLTRLPAGLDIGELVFASPGATGEALNAHAGYRTILDGLELGSRDRFNASRWWFTDPKTAFTLVGVVNRIDRRDFGQTACGETRLLYRLGFSEAGGATQRLPVAFNVVFEQPDDGQGCVEVARRWMVDEGEDVVDVLTREGGPLHPSRLSRAQLLAIETNVRVGEGPDGDGMNELRSFAWDRDTLELEPTRLELEAQWKTLMVRANVREFLTPEGFAVIDRGAGLLPFDTERWAEVRLHDRRQDEYDVMWKRFENHGEATPLPDTGFSSTRASIANRLRGMSCSGCHRRRSVAGFHLPGEGGSEQLRGGASAHLLSELPWRERYVAALAAGQTPERTRQLPNQGPPGFGRHCSVEHSPIDTLGCDPHFECVAVPGEDFGACMPAGYAGPGPCEKASESCREPSPWFPGGFERLACVKDQPCASIVRTTDFSSCKDEVDAWACAEQRAERVRVDGCAQQSDCRDGYVCVELDGGSEEGAGAGGGCLPHAMVAEFRILGHRKRLR